MATHWHRLIRKQQLERVLQVVFESWGDKGRSGFEVGGVPGWLGSLGNPIRQKRIRQLDHAFTPDVLWPDARVVVELKSSAKFEPMAMAEVLHHARALELRDGKAYTAGMVTSYSAWLRLALDFLESRSLAPGEIRYLEADHLVLAGSDRRFLWLDAPRAPWRAATELPPCLAAVSALYPAWYFAEETRSWIGVDRPSAARPTFLVGRYAMLTPIDRSRDAFLFWRGHGAGDASVAASDSAGAYWLWDPSVPGGCSLPDARAA